MKNLGQNDNWQPLADALRDELRECAWLLSLLDKQQKAILAREAPLVTEVSDAILAQNEQIRQFRSTREALMLRACLTFGLSNDTALAGVITVMPEVLRPLFEALIHEGLSLRRRIRRRTEMNHRIARRAASCASELLEIVRPQSVTRTYGPKGAMKTSMGLKGRMIHTAV
jgi:flagellar biosynthesis/type III secretory pathway chaperone